MKISMERLPAQPMVFMRRTGAYGPENFKLMAALKNWAEENGLLDQGVIYGIPRDGADIPPEKQRYDVCLTVSADFPLDTAVERGVIPSGQYAVFTIAHTAEAVQAFWNSVFQVLREHKLRFHRDKPILERYQRDFVERGLCEFCVPVL